jgi:hypothetical protein
LLNTKGTKDTKRWQVILYITYLIYGNEVLCVDITLGKVKKMTIKIHAAKKLIMLVVLLLNPFLLEMIVVQKNNGIPILAHNITLI